MVTPTGGERKAPPDQWWLVAASVAPGVQEPDTGLCGEQSSAKAQSADSPGLQGNLKSKHTGIRGHRATLRRQAGLLGRPRCVSEASFQAVRIRRGSQTHTAGLQKPLGCC